MISRRVAPVVVERLRHSPAVALLGPRQVGKTTLARQVFARTHQAGEINSDAINTSSNETLYLDLDLDADRRKLADAKSYLSARENMLVIIDEVHRAPEIFRTLRSLIDDGIRRGRSAGRFLLLGSASIELLNQSSETLAGRIAFLELTPLDVLEIPDNGAERLWIRGGFAKSHLAESDQQSATWRDDFIRTYLHRDIPSFGSSVPAETLRRFWTMLAHVQGGLHNAAALAKSLSVEGKSIARYLDLLVDLLLVRRLPPYFANTRKRLVKSPKIYIRDSGVIHSLLGLRDTEAVLGHPVSGASWEGFVIENILRCAPAFAEGAFYRSSAGAEIDLVLTLSGNEAWAIEIKRGGAPKLERGFYNACEDIAPQRKFVVHGGEERYPMANGVEAIGLAEICREVAALA